MIQKFERIKLGHFPTPIEYLKNLTRHLNGPEIFIKRDDCTGLATGGNKTRKLEYLMPDALNNNANLIITAGAVQSNHARQTAAACAVLGLKCLIILEQRVANMPNIYMTSGNVFLNKLFGAEIIMCPREKDLKKFTEEIIDDRKKQGFIPYYIPVGGSNHIGELGYIECMREITEYNNQKIFSHIISASGSGGTHSGLIVGKKYYKYNTNIIGISVKDNKKVQEEKVLKLAKSACNFVKCAYPEKQDIMVLDEYVGDGYGVPTIGMKKALRLLAEKEAILLDPVYSGKAFDGFLDLVNKKYFKKTDRVLFIHTGGSVSLSAYEWAFQE